MKEILFYVGCVMAVVSFVMLISECDSLGLFLVKTVLSIAGMLAGNKLMLVSGHKF